MKIEYRAYDPDRDGAAAVRIFAEVGWLDRERTDRCESVKERFRHANGYVATVDGEVECLASAAPGTIHYVDQALPFSAVTNVATGMGGRKLGLATKLTARLIADGVAMGQAVSGLGVFETGFYDRLGYGTGPYEHFVQFDPASLTVPTPKEPPKRIPNSEFEAIHAARLARRTSHGWVTLEHAVQTKDDLNLMPNSFGLGYYDGPGGTLSHFVWLVPTRQEHGPFAVQFMAYRTLDDYIELLGILKTLGDQVNTIEMLEHADIQLQDFVRQPIRTARATEGGKHETGIESLAFWQIRICDLETCVRAVRIEGPALQFNLRLTDPIEAHLDQHDTWRGLQGNYVVSFGAQSEVHPGENASLPTLEASINAFSRVWLGVRPATGLAHTEALSGPPDLLARLDHAFRLPPARRDWNF